MAGSVSTLLTLDNCFSLICFVKYVLFVGVAEDDLVLEVVILIGTVSLDDACATVFAREGIIQMLIDLLNGKNHQQVFHAAL